MQLPITLAQAIAQMPMPQPPARSPEPSPDANSLANPFDTFDRTVHDMAHAASGVVREWCYAAHAGKARGLVLWSEKSTSPDGQVLGFGCGKTHLAQCAYTYLRQCAWRDARDIPHAMPVTFINTVDFYGAFRDCYAEDRPEWPLFNAWGRTHFILDDFGKEHVKAESLPWAREKFYRLIDRLYGNYSLLITSNLSPESIERLIGDASWSRLVGMCGPRGFINMSGIADYRLRKAGL